MTDCQECIQCISIVVAAGLLPGRGRRDGVRTTIVNKLLERIRLTAESMEGAQLAYDRDENRREEGRRDNTT